MSRGPTIHLWVGTVYLAQNRCSVNKTYDITHLPFSHNNLEGYFSSFSFSSWGNKTWEEKLLPNDTQQRGDSISPEFCFRAPGFATTVCHISYWSVGLACLGQVHSSRTEQGRQKISWRHSGGRVGGGKVASLHSKRSSLLYSNVTSKLDVIENQLTLLNYEHCTLQIQPASQYVPHWGALTGVPWQVTIANHLENSTCDLEICQGFQ